MKKRGDAGAPAACLVTPKGEGGISVVALWGRGALEVLRRHLMSRSGRRKTIEHGKLALGLFRAAGGELLDEVIVACGGGDYVEINCHGGLLPAQRVLKSLEESGVRIEDPGAALERLQPVDLVRREAVVALLDARTDLAARVLAAQAGGLLSEALSQVMTGLASPAACKDALRKLCSLKDSARLGIALANPPAVAVVGPPNAGKSSLVNRLAGYERNIVADVPGTTRDAVRVPVALFGLPVILIDTAGPGTGGILAREARNRASQALSEADAVLVVVDSSAGLPDGYVPPPGRLPRVVAANKSDLPPAAGTRAVVAAWGGASVNTSALTGEGMAELSIALLVALGVGVPDASLATRPVVFSKRQLVAVTAAIDALASRDTQGARSALAECLGVS